MSTDKIRNIAVKRTNIQEDSDWSKVLSKKGRLLESSDWTQLSDVHLLPDDKIAWSKWRERVRGITRSKFTTHDLAAQALEMIESDRPKTYTFDYGERKKAELVSTDLPKTEEESTIQRVYMVQQPLYFNETISDDKFRKHFYTAFETMPTDLKDFLRTILFHTEEIVFVPSDELDDAKSKMSEFLIKKQKEFLSAKMAKIPPHQIVAERFEQALEFLTHDDKLDTSDYPLLHLYSQINKLSIEEVAELFLNQKNQFNKIIFDNEKFGLYNQKRINDCEDLEDLNYILVEIKNGY